MIIVFISAGFAYSGQRISVNMQGIAMKIRFKTWTALGVTTALAGAGISGCSGEAGEAGEDGAPVASGEGGAVGAGEAGEGEGGEGEGGEGGAGGDIAALPVEQRLAFMSGHVEAGMALYRAGDSAAAAPHLLHPVSETHAAERAGLERLGFEPALFEDVSQAIEAGRPAQDIEPQLRAAERNLRSMREKAGGDPAVLIRYLMDVTVEEYTVAVSNGSVTDPGEYQDAWGFAKAARRLAGSLEGSDGQKTRAALDELIRLWPGGAPIPPSSPAPAGQVSALASRVVLALPQ